MIIGNTLESLFYAWRTQQRIILVDPTYVFRYDDKYQNYDFSFINARDAKEMWVNLCFAMSFSSLLLFPNNVKSLRETEYGLNVFTKGSKAREVFTDNVQYFDQKVDDLYDIYDFFDTRLMKPHKKHQITDNDNFVKKINFYVSPRGDKGTTKDLVASSIMSREQLFNPDWGNGIVKLKVLRMLASEGITGHLSVRTPKKTYYKKPKIEFYKRIVSERWEPQMTFDEIYNMEQVKGESWKMIQKLRLR